MKELLLTPDDTLRKLVSAFSLGNIRYSLEIIQDYYTSFHSLFHEYYEVYKEAGELPKDCAVDVTKEFLHFLQALMLGNDWSYDERDSEIYNLFAVGQDEQSSHFIAAVILAYLSRDSLSPKSSVRLEKLYNDLISLGYPKHHVEQVVRRLLRSSILLAPTNPVGMFKNKDVPELQGEMRISISAKGYYYLNYLASYSYYQMRVAEDTIWYDSERATLFIKALRDSLDVQEQHGSSDYLIATDAREVFNQYLKRAWLAEYQSSKAKVEWARVVRSIVEEKVFGSQITQSVHFKEEKSAPETEQRPALIQQPLPSIPKDTDKDEPKQLSIFPTEPPNYEQVFADNARNLGTMPNSTKVNRSTYILKALWAMELGFRCGWPKLRAADIARLINDYGKGDVESTNVAKFFRGQRKTNEFTHLWTENPEGYFTINNFGRDFLSSYLDGLS
jgi:hypothetical protein